MCTRGDVGLRAELGARNRLLPSSLRLDLLLARCRDDLFLVVVGLELFEVAFVGAGQSVATALQGFVVALALEFGHVAVLDALRLGRQVLQDLQLFPTEDEWSHHLLGALDPLPRQQVRLRAGRDLEDGAQRLVGIAELVGQDEGQKRLRRGTWR